MDDITILLTGTGAPGAPSIIKCFKKNGERNIRIVGVDMNEKASSRGMVDVFYKVPSASDSNYINTIFSICKKEGARIIVPLVTKELKVFACERTLFERSGIAVSVMDQHPLSIANNKARLLSAMKEAGMDTPDFYVVNSIDEVKEAFVKIGYPKKAVCIKPAIGNGSRGIRIVDKRISRAEILFGEKPNSKYISYDELMSTLNELESLPEMVVMDYLPGDEYGVDALCEDGKVLYIAGRYNAKVSSSIPQESIIDNRKEPIEICQELISKLHMDGNVNFDFIYDGNGYPMLIEINPRLSATIVAYAPAGINFPYLRIKQLLGETLPNNSIKVGLHMQRRYNEVFYDEDGKEISW